MDEAELLVALLDATARCIHLTADTITLQASLYVNRTLAIVGMAATGALTSLDGQDTTRVLHIDAATPNTLVVLSRVRITRGYADGGGGILCNGGIVKLAFCEVVGNAAQGPGTSGAGGGICVLGSRLFVSFASRILCNSR